MDRFYTERFIELVRDRPAIWDQRCEEYSDNIKRNNAWREIGKICYSGFNKMEAGKQRETVKELNKKWKNLRQCYKRELDSQIPKSGSARKKKTQYVYFELLSFLAPIFDSNSTHSNIAVTEGGDAKEVKKETPVLKGLETEKINTTLPSTSNQSFRPSMRKRQVDNPVADVCQLLKTTLNERMAAEKRRRKKEECDEDYNFLISLLNYTRAVQGMNKLAMRSELLQVVTRYYNMSVHPQNDLSQAYQQPPVFQAMPANVFHSQYSPFPTSHPTSHSSVYSESCLPTPAVTSPQPSSAHSSHSASLEMSPLSSEFSHESSHI